MAPRVLLDTTVMSNFAGVQRSDLLYVRFGADAGTTISCLAELRMGEIVGRIPLCDWAWLAVVALTDLELERAASLATHQGLGRGEADGVAVAEARSILFLSDDKRARTVAASLKIGVSGTLGILTGLVETAALSAQDADELLGRMRAHGYRSPVASIHELLR